MNKLKDEKRPQQSQGFISEFKGSYGLTIPWVKTLRGVRARVSGIVSLNRIG